MEKEHRGNPWARYADDGLIHCNSESEAQTILEALKLRMKECGLEIHPDKTKIVYCKSDNNNQSYENESFDFLGYTFRRRFVRSKAGYYFNSFTPAVSREAGKAFRSKIKEMSIRNKGKDLYEIAEIMNPVIRGWANYFTKFGSNEAKKTLNYVNLALLKMVPDRYRTKGKSKWKAWRFLTSLTRQEPELFYHWKMGLVPAIG
jgi:RNA-directed DNA polymerase